MAFNIFFNYISKLCMVVIFISYTNNLNYYYKEYQTKYLIENNIRIIRNKCKIRESYDDLL